MAYTRLNPNNRHPGGRKAPGKHLRALGILLATLLLPPSAISETALATPEEALHLGAASCASSLCHGSVQPFEGSPIAQNEFIIWQSDRYRNMHAKAFNKLLSKEAGEIAKKLGLGPAAEAPECLSCHADLVADEFHGEKFQLSDGVSCESCHGAAGEYIDIHTDPEKELQELKQYGLYPSWEPVARAKLCLSCHLGGEQRIINHRFMGAGHPRLSFELDTFTYLQPHHVVDQDYVERKGEVDFVRDWALGQALATIQSLDWLMDRDSGWHGIFVEPALLDCHSCHRRMDEGHWKMRASTGLGPGEMRLNDANLVMIRLVMLAIRPELARELHEGGSALHQATTVSLEAVFETATLLKLSLKNTIIALTGHRFRLEDLQNILREIERQASAGEFRDYVAAEQVAMAMVNLVLAFERAGLLEKDSLRSDLDRLFETVADDYDYSEREMVATIRSLLKKLTL